MLKHCVLLFAIFLCQALIRADYAIDDSNDSVLKFSENSSGPAWGPFGSDTGEVLKVQLPNGTIQSVDANPCYDETFTYAPCTTSDNCAVQFSFTGSGITVYVLQAGPQGMSASLSIDSGTARTATLDAPSPPQYYHRRVTLFKVQNIPSGTHSAVMTVLDWNGGFSGMMLDYINVNETEVAGPSTGLAASPSSSPNPSFASPGPTSVPTLTASPLAGTQTTLQGSTGPQAITRIASVASFASVFSSQLLGGSALPSGAGTPSGNGTDKSTFSTYHTDSIIVGTTVGGVSALALVALALFCYRRRLKQRHAQALIKRPSPLLIPQPEARFTSYNDANADPFNSSSVVISASQPSSPWTVLEIGSATHLVTRDQRSSTPLETDSHAHTRSSGEDGAISCSPVSISVGSATAPRDDQDASTPVTEQMPVSSPSDKPQSPCEPVPTRQVSASGQDGPSAHQNVILTDEQAEFVNRLFSNSVPAPVVACMIERMVANRRGTNSTGASDPELHGHVDSRIMSFQTQTGRVLWLPTTSDIRDGDGDEDGETTVSLAPPSYDYARAL